jgi:hypothetical protein
MTNVTVEGTLVNVIRYGNIPETVYGIPAIPVDPFQLAAPCWYWNNKKLENNEKNTGQGGANNL